MSTTRFTIWKREEFHHAWLIAVALLAVSGLVNLSPTPVMAFQESDSTLTTTPQAADDEPTTPPKTTGGTTTNVPSTNKKAFQGDVIYLPNKDGDLVPVPLNSKYEEYLDWLSKSEDIPTESPYNISSVVVSGQAVKFNSGKEFIKVQIEVRLSLYRDSWTQVPLELSELIVSDNVEHTGPGDFVFDRRDPLRGLLWWGKGVGKHTLKMQGYVPLRRDLNTRRLTMRVPKTLVNELIISVPEPRVELTNTNEDGISTVTAKNGSSIISVRGGIDRVDLSWRTMPDPKTNRNLFESTSTMVLSASGADYTLNVNQILSSLQGAIETAEVTPPSQFELISLKSDNLASYEVVDESTGRLELRFDQPVTDRITLFWEFRRKATTGEMPLVINGLDVQGTELESGEILISQMEEKQVLPVDIDSQLIIVSRTDNQSVPGVYTSAFRFLRQPFELKLSVVNVQPDFTVQPEHLLSVHDDHLELETRLRINILNGSLNRIALKWPKSNDISWEIDPFITGGMDVAWNRGKDDVYEIVFDKPVSGNRELIFKAMLPVVPAEKTRTIRLPSVQDGRGFPPQIAIADASNMKTIVNFGQTLLAKIDMQKGLDQFAWSSSENDFRYQFFEVQSDGEPIGVELASREYAQEVASKAMMTATIENDSIQVLERMEINVEREPLTELHVNLPATTNVQFWLEDDPLTQMIATSYELNGQRRGVLTFKPGLLQSRRIVASYQIPRTTDDSNISLPVITPVGHEFSELAVEVDPTSRLAAAVVGPIQSQWTTQLTAEGNQRSTATNPQDAVVIQIQAGATVRPIVFADRRVFVKTVATGQLKSSTIVSGVITDGGDVVSFDLPDDAENLTARAGGIFIKDFALLDADRNLVAFDLSESAASRPLTFEIRYEQPTKRIGLLGRKVDFASPWIMEATGTEYVWTIQVPNGEHLLHASRSLFPVFQWGFHGYRWTRMNDAELSRKAAISMLLANSGPGNRYQFILNQQGEVPITVITIRQSILLLSGGCIGLILGLFLVRGMDLWGPIWPAVTVAFILFSAFLFDETRLFLQPVVMGLLLSVVAYSINRRTRRSLNHLGPARSHTMRSQSSPGSSLSVWQAPDLDAAQTPDSTQAHPVEIPSAAGQPVASSDSGKAIP